MVQIASLDLMDCRWWNLFMNEEETGDGHPIATRPTAHSRAQEGQELTASFERQVMPLRDELYRAARRLTPQPGDAEDLVQETLLKAFVGFHSFRQGTNLGGWLHRIMTNTWINRYRASQRRPDERLADEITDAELLADARHT